MKTKLIGTALALGLATLPLASFAGGVGGGNANSNWTIYGWQNWSYEFVDVEDHYGPGVDRDLTRISNNAANLGFSADIDTGVSVAGQAVKATFRCEQFTFHNRFVGSGFFGFNDFCNRNSKIGLAGPWGEVMFANWLLPHNEMVAQWVDPFYDAGADSHTSIMGNVGGGTGRFFNGGFGFDNGGGFGGLTNFGSGFGSENNAFNRRQNGVVQWMSPNWGGFTARIATTSAQQDPGFNYFNGNDEVRVTTAIGTAELDPRIWSLGIAYETGVGGGGSSVWFAVTYEEHDEWAAVDFGCEDSDDSSWRLAGRYIHDWGNGHSTWISGMYEDLEYEHDDCASGDGFLGGTGVAGSTEVERDAWMISGKHNFPGPLDFRFSYMDADDLDCDLNGVSGVCLGNAAGTDNSTDADAYNVGLFYTMPAGTELRVTYSEVSNGNNAHYDFGISPAGVGVGGDLEMFAFGIVQWF